MFEISNSCSVVAIHGLDTHSPRRGRKMEIQIQEK